MQKNKLRKDCFSIIRSALDAVNPKRTVKNSLKVSEGRLVIKGKNFKFSEINNIFVVGGGKASGFMAEAIEELLGDRIKKGVVNVLKGTKKKFKTRKIELFEASHPIPDEDSVEGTKKIIKIAEDASEGDLVIALISGGGSALMTYPVPEVGLEDLKKTTSLIMKSGATINELNAVRKHLSLIKGGQLSKAAYPAKILSLIISDVVGDPLDVIASGPTSPDTSTFSDAREVLVSRGLWKAAPQSVRDRIEEGIEGKVPETPKPGDKIFRQTTNVIIANNDLALEAAERKAKELGYNTLIASTFLEGEARHVGTVIGSIALEIKKKNRPLKKPAAVFFGGETTVTVKGKGTGGRNQELVLSAALKISGERNLIVASIGTDGVDGNSDAAGALAGGETIKDAIGKKLNPLAYLDNNDTYTFFKKLGSLIVTGPTGTNVNDLTLILAGD